MDRVVLSFKGSKYIHLRLVLQNDAGVASIMRALKGAMMVEGMEAYEEPPTVTVGDEVTLDIKQLPRNTRFRIKVDGITHDVPDPASKPKRPALNGHKPKALPAPSNQLGLRFGRGGS